jgi:hypothetical protein
MQVPLLPVSSTGYSLFKVVGKHIFIYLRIIENGKIGHGRPRV